MINNRVIDEALCLIKTNMTIRQIANKYKVSKSTVHKDLKERLPLINIDLSKKVDNILLVHLLNRHINGGEITRLKYQKIK